MPARTRRQDQTATDEPQTDVTGLTSDQPEAEAQQGGETAAPTDTLSADFLAAPVILDMTAAPEFVKASAPQRARSASQQAMDDTVKKLHEAWQGAGRPSVWGAIVNAKVVGTYFVTPEQVAGLKKKVNRAKLLLDIRIKWGSEFVATPEMIARFNLPAEYEGRTVVSFAAMDKRPRTTPNGQAQVTATNGDDDDDDDEDDEDS